MAKGKKMSASLKAFLKKHGRFPKKGEMSRASAAGTRKGKKRSHRSNPGPTKQYAPKIGAAYQSAWVTASVAAPVYDEVASRVLAKRSLTEGAGPALRTKVLNTAYGANLLITAADVWVDKKVGQAAAMSRGSATAIIPELYLGAIALDEGRAQGWGRGAARTIPQRLFKARNAYDPAFDALNPSNPEFVTYRVVKHGLQAARIVANRTKFGRAFTEPLRKGLRALGATT